MQIFNRHYDWLLLAFSKDQVLKGIECAAATLRRVERLPQRLVGGNVEQGQNCGEVGREALIEVEELRATLFRISRTPSLSSILK